MVLVFVAPNPDGLPVPISQIGQYDRGNGRSETAFTEGEVLIREGTSNVRLRFAHWNQLLDRYREQIKAESRRDADELIRRVVEGLRGGVAGQERAVPLDAGMDEETLVEALVVLFESGSTIRVQQFLNGAGLRAGAGGPDDRDERLRAMNQITVIACQAVVYAQTDTFRIAVEALEHAYNARLSSTGGTGSLKVDPQTAQHYLDVLVRVVAIGALAVRRKAWALLPELATRPVTVDGYAWTSWMRHAFTIAARAHLMQNSGGQMLSQARALVAASPALRSDYSADTVIPPAEQLSDRDWLLNSICEFDLWWCVITVVKRGEERSLSGSFYPSCAAFHQWRAQPTLEHIATQPQVRRDVFGDATDAAIADAIVAVLDTAVKESYQYGGWWDGLEAGMSVSTYVAAHATSQ